MDTTAVREASEDGRDPDAAGPQATGAAGRIVPAVETALILLGLALLAFGQEHVMYADAVARAQALAQFVDGRGLSDSPYSMIGPLFAAPLLGIGRRLGDPEAWLTQYNLLVFALGLAIAYALLRNRMDRTLLRRFLLLLVAASMIAPHVANFYGEPFSAIGVGIGILAAAIRTAGPGTRVAGWIGVVLGTANAPATIAGLAVVGGAETVRHKRIRYVLPVLAGAALIAGEGWLRRGGPFDSGYGGDAGFQTVMPYSGLPGFSYPFVLGVVGILFSFGKGVLWYAPGLVLPFRRKLRELHDPAEVDLWRVWVLWILFMVGMALVYTRWWAWYGGQYWGPRFFLLAILPASLALAVCLRYRGATILSNLGTLLVLALSVWIGADSLVYGGLFPSTCYDNNYALETLCTFTPEYSPLWYPFVAKPALAGVQWVDLCYYLVVFAWLAAPVLRRLWGQVGGWFTAWRQGAPARGWRW